MKRLANLMGKDGKVFMLAMDHAMIMDVGQVLKDPRRVVSAAVANGADSVLTTVGAAEYCINEIGKAGLLIRSDLGTTVAHHSGKPFVNSFSFASVESALRLGADGIINLLLTHMKEGNDEERSLERNARDAGLCHEYGVALCIEPMPGGFAYPEVQNIESVALATRIACELGADMVKSLYYDVPEYTSRVVEQCYRPLIVLGGGGVRSDRELLESTKAAMDAGCVGAAYGRVIWNHKNVEGICQAVASIIHGGASVEDALKFI